MTDARTAWADVGDRLSALCLKLKLHAEEELTDDDIRSKTGLDKLRAVIEETADAIGDAYEDEAVRADAKDMARAFVDAVDATVQDARKRLG
jgi:predicted ArsR family transcriptional regulator